jgi:hypothetical protein
MLHSTLARYWTAPKGAGVGQMLTRAAHAQGVERMKPRVVNFDFERNENGRPITHKKTWAMRTPYTSGGRVWVERDEVA